MSLGLSVFLMTDIFAMMGIDTRGGEFAFAKEPKTLEEKAALIRTARNDLQLLIDDDYIYEELEIEKPKDYDRLKREEKEQREEYRRAMMERTAKETNTRQDDSSDSGSTKENHARFFGQSPDYRALKW